MRPIAPKGVGRPKTAQIGQMTDTISHRRPTMAARQDQRIEQAIINIPLDPYLSLKVLATYSGLNVRKLREYLDHLSHLLPHYRMGGKILVRRSEFDAWIAIYRQVGNTKVDQIVIEVLFALD